MCFLRVLLLSVAVMCAAAIGVASEGDRRVAGIDIGAKGIKGVVAEVPADASQAVRVIETKTINPTLFTGERLSESGIAEAIAGVTDLRNWIGELRVPADQIYIVASSSVASAPNRDELAQALREQKGIDLKFMSRDEEARLSIVGLMSQAERVNGLLIDIGSGNTKGGALREGHLVPIGLEFGTVTYTSRMLGDGMVLPPGDKRDSLRAELLTGPLQRQIKQQPELAAGGPRILTGGIAWAVATLTHPEALEQAQVTLAPEDFNRLREQLNASPSEFPEADFSRVTDPRLRTAADQELDRVRRIFTPQNLAAGLDIVQALEESLPATGSLTFARNGMAAWILGYAVERQERRSEVKPEAVEQSRQKPVSTPVQQAVPALPTAVFALVNGHIGTAVVDPAGNLFVEERCARCGTFKYHAIARFSGLVPVNWQLVVPRLVGQGYDGRLLHDGCQFVLAE